MFWTQPLCSRSHIVKQIVVAIRFGSFRICSKLAAMDIHHLRTIVTIARAGSIARAAERLALSQPTLSGHVRTLEDSFGFSLFERQARGMVPTEAGQRLLRHAEALLAARDDLLNEAATIGKQVRGHVTLGVPPTMGALRLDRLLDGLADRHPGVSLTFRTALSAQILDDVAEGRLDGGYVIVARAPDPPDLTLVALKRLRVCAVAPAQWADRMQGTEPLADLPWVLPVPGTLCHHVAEKVLALHQIHPRHVVCTANEIVARDLIKKGVGLGFVHEESPAPAASHDGLLRLDGYCGDACLSFAYAPGRDTASRLAAVAAMVRATWDRLES